MRLMLLVRESHFGNHCTKSHLETIVMNDQFTHNCQSKHLHRWYERNKLEHLRTICHVIVSWWPLMLEIHPHLVSWKEHWIRTWLSILGLEPVIYNPLRNSWTSLSPNFSICTSRLSRSRLWTADPSELPQAILAPPPPTSVDFCSWLLSKTVVCL